MKANVANATRISMPAMIIAAADENSGTVGDALGEAVGESLGVGVGEFVGVEVLMGVGVGVDDDVDCSFQFHVMLEAAVIVKVTTDVLPDDGTLPVPVQPTQLYPEVGDETKSVMLVALSNHPLVGEGESCAEVTIK